MIPCKYQQTMVSTMVSKWCAMDFVHPQYAPKRGHGLDGVNPHVHGRRHRGGRLHRSDVRVVSVEVPGPSKIPT